MRTTQDEDRIIDAYAQVTGKSKTDLFKDALFKQIEDEIDISMYRDRIAKIEAGEETYSLEDARKLVS
jgi:predicted DNA-binding protein